MENIIVSLIMVGVLVFGFYIVDLFGRAIDEGRENRGRRPSGKEKGGRAAGPDRFFR